MHLLTQTGQAATLFVVTSTVLSRTDETFIESHHRRLIRCPSCGSDRLIPLTFGIVSIEDRSELERRPVAKCAK
jgi:ribosomal protein L37AE/L43A